MRDPVTKKAWSGGLLFIWIAAAMICFAIWGAAKDAPQVCASMDVDTDGDVSAADARLILRFAVGLEQPEGPAFFRADPDADGAVTAADARAALRVSVGLQNRPAHKIVTEAEAVPPTCTETGLSERLVCLRCEYVSQEEIPALGHDWQPADCASPETCALCGKTRGFANGHDWVRAGSGGILKCAECGLSTHPGKAHRFTALSGATASGICELCGAARDRRGRGILGICFHPAIGAASCRRICDAQALQNDYLIGDGFVNGGQNDFDALAPFSEIRRCCLKGDAVIYEGEPGYAEDGSAGDVFVEIPLFWSCTESLCGAVRLAVSPTAQPGFSPEPAFVRADGTLAEHIYVAAYATGGENVSASGLLPTVRERISSYMAGAAEKGFGVYDAAVWAALQKLIVVEFGTLDLSGCLGGIGELPYWDNCVAVESEKDTNRIVIDPYSVQMTQRLDGLMAGAAVFVGRSAGDFGGAADTRFIRSVKTRYDGCLVVTFDGDPIDVREGQTVICGVGQPSGATDALAYHTGRYEGNYTSAFLYRGIENLWGNVWTQTAGLCVKDLSYYVTADPSLYKAPLSEWHKLSFDAPEQNRYPFVPGVGWIGSFGFDADAPWLLLPDSAGWNWEFVGDKIYSTALTDPDGREIPPGTEFLCMTGGGWDHADRSGPFTVRFWSGRWSGVSWLYGSRMVKR